MPAIAIDLAVLLPAKARAVVERLNSGLTGHGFRFDATHHPRVTLSQHFVTDARLTQLYGEVETVLSGLPPLHLQVTGARKGRTAQVLVLTPTPALQQLHTHLMDTLAAYEVPGDAAAFQQDGDPPRNADAAWVTRYRANSSFARFDPHITIGIGSDPVATAPFTFTGHTIAVYRLGRFCTCRDRLAHWTL